MSEEVINNSAAEQYSANSIQVLERKIHMMQTVFRCWKVLRRLGNARQCI